MTIIEPCSECITLRAFTFSNTILISPSSPFSVVGVTSESGGPNLGRLIGTSGSASESLLAALSEVPEGERGGTDDDVGESGDGGAENEKPLNRPLKKRVRVEGLISGEWTSSNFSSSS